MAAVGFFDRQNQARRHTRSLVMLFVLAVAGVIAGVNAVVVLAVHGEELAETSNRAVFLPTIGITTALLLLLIGGAMLLRMSQLSKGGSAVAEALGGTRVDDDTRDPQLRQLRNVVEEMAIASGVPAPAVFVLENEHALNAFAAG
ncbi:MAG: peptidase M48, partial [Oceanococcaceae bacterium]